jgi:hypothetical protein
LVAPVRWNRDTEEFEYRCDSCRDKNSRYFWPLTLDFWSPNTNMTRCRACNAEHKAKITREKRRNDPEYRQKCVTQTRELRKLKGPIYEASRKRGRAA